MKKKATRRKKAAKKHTPQQRSQKKRDYEELKPYQFKPGQSGNPKGSPKGRTNLWKFFCEYMELSLAELEREKKKKGLSASRRAAITLAIDFAQGKYTASQRLARYVVDREEGKPTEYIVTGSDDNVMSPEKCDEIREILKKNHDEQK